jgi:hypothetical protein
MKAVKSLIVCASVLLLAGVGATTASADHCADLAGKQLCMRFCYSGPINCDEATATFGLPNVIGGFTLGSGSTFGNFQCKGNNFVQVQYFIGADEYVWFAEARNRGKKIFGHGKYFPLGDFLLFSLKSKRSGACP